MSKLTQTIFATLLWASISTGCAAPPLNSPLNSPIGTRVSGSDVFYSERGTTLAYASGEGGFAHLALMSGKLVRVQGCLLLEHSPSEYAFPIWNHRVRFIDSGANELVIASNGKIIGAVGESISPFGGGYFSLAELPENGRRYLDAQTPTCKGLYDGIAMINVR